MKYNDEFVLPPKEVLNKMRVEYQKSQKTQINSYKKNESKAELNTFINLCYDYTYFLNSLLSYSNNALLKRKISFVLYKTQKHIELISKSKQKINFKAIKKAVPKDQKHQIKQMLFYEHKLISKLIKLKKSDKQNDKINLILDERIKALHQLISFI